MFSSVSKGETLEDTIKIIGGYSDFIVLRHSENDSAERAMNVGGKPVINAGSGEHQHPTQALLDTYTIFKEMGRLEDLEITVIGDLLRGRTCDSLVYLMAKFPGNRFNLISPENSKAKPALIEYLESLGCKYHESSELNEVLGKTDVVYMTRIQKERFKSEAEYEAAKGLYVLDPSNVVYLNRRSIILHPLPRVDEISPELDGDSRAKYFRQAHNGLYVRMALFKGIMDHQQKR